VVLRGHSPDKSIFFKKWPRNLIFGNKTAIETYLKIYIKKIENGQKWRVFGLSKWPTLAKSEKFQKPRQRNLKIRKQVNSPNWHG